MTAVQPFSIHVSDEVLADLCERLARTRWPGELPGAAWDYSTNLTYVRELVDYWHTQFDWRALAGGHA
jgi:microsomal epoxide hydrolase